MTTWLIKHAGAFLNLSMLGFVFCCFGSGFAAHLAPAAVGHFLYGGIMFLIGAVGNAAVVLSTQQKERPWKRRS